MEVTLQDMLQAREDRAAAQQLLLRRFGKPLVCFTMNIAGPIKDSPAIRRGFLAGLRDLTGLLEVEGLPILHRQSRRSSTGWEELMVVDGPARRIKDLTCQLEEMSDLGRLFDMDVLDPSGEKLSRPLPRRCLICGAQAQVCARSRTHTVAALQEKTRSLLEAAILEEDSTFAAQMALQALLYEVGVTPKPGLVDRRNTGSHRDMDFFTFQRSAAALYPYFAQCLRLGRATRQETPAHTLAALRLPGKLAQSRMEAATGGVNTHKGAIFSLGLLCGALGRLDREDWGHPDSVLALCGAMAEGLLEEFNTPGDTVGHRLYRDYGITGIRGQAAAGYPAVRDIGLPKLETGLNRGLSLNDAACGTLLALIAGTADTNLIHRGGVSRQRQVARELAALLEADPFPPPSVLEALDDGFIRENLSPGGSADLLAMTLMLWFLKGERHV